jgi:hypothetical protein
METEVVAVPEGILSGSQTYAQGIAARFSAYQNALKTGLSSLITTARGNLQTYALNPTSLELGYDPTPPNGWEYLVSATKSNGSVVEDSVSIYPGVVKNTNGTVSLVYPAL